MPEDIRASRSGDGAGVRVSFEFFPPKTSEMDAQLWEAITRLAPLRPKFVSVTYGAGGSTRSRTHATVERIARETYLRPAAHLTCVGASKGEIDDVIDPADTRAVISRTLHLLRSKRENLPQRKHGNIPL